MSMEPRLDLIIYFSSDSTYSTNKLDHFIAGTIFCADLNWESLQYRVSKYYFKINYGIGPISRVNLLTISKLDCFIIAFHCKGRLVASLKNVKHGLKCLSLTIEQHVFDTNAGKQLS